MKCSWCSKRGFENIWFPTSLTRIFKDVERSKFTIGYIVSNLLNVSSSGSILLFHAIFKSTLQNLLWYVRYQPEQPKTAITPF